MAIQSICGTLISGLDTACNPPVRSYYQQAVVINKTDVETWELPTFSEGTCDYKVGFTLKTGTTGYLFQSPDNGTTVKGFTDKTVSDLGHPQFVHHAQFLVTGIDEATKCILDALTRGNYVVALQLTDGTVEIYGTENGLISADFTYDIAEGGGGTPLDLMSREIAPENYLPFIYESGTPGGENADFDSLFAQP